jgi:hypothetical protein
MEATCRDFENGGPSQAFPELSSDILSFPLRVLKNRVTPILCWMEFSIGTTHDVRMSILPKEG